MNSRFRITVGSVPEYEDLVGDLYYDDGIVCILTQEHGFNAMQIRIFGPPSGREWTFSYAEFQEALEALSSRMWELRRGAETSD